MPESFEAPVQPPSRPYRALRILGMVALGIVIIWAVRHLDGRAIVRTIARSDWKLLVAAIGANLVAMSFQSWRWRVLLESLGPAPYWNVTSVMILGFACSSLLPARAGELVRVHLMAREMGVRRAAVAGTALLDHVVNGISVIPVLAVLPFLADVPVWMQRSLMIVLSVVSFAALLAWVSADPRVVRDHPTSWRRLIARLRHGLSGARSPRRMSQAAFASLVAWAMEVAVVWLSLRAFEPRFGLAISILTLVSVNLAIAAPSPPGNFGTLEVGAVLVLTAFGMPREEAVAYALAYHALQLVSVWAACAPAWWWTRRTLTAE